MDHPRPFAGLAAAADGRAGPGLVAEAGRLDLGQHARSGHRHPGWRAGAAAGRRRDRALIGARLVAAAVAHFGRAAVRVDHIRRRRSVALVLPDVEAIDAAGVDRLAAGGTLGRTIGEAFGEQHAARGGTRHGEGFAIPDVVSEDLDVVVLPPQDDEFTCSECFIVKHHSLLSPKKGKYGKVCIECEG